MSLGTSKLTAGILGPCGVAASAAAAGLIATRAADTDSLTRLLGWTLLACGLAYAGRLPIHIWACTYVSLHPGTTDEPVLRRRLNFLTSLNAVSIVAWLALAAMLISGLDITILVSGVMAVFYGLIVWLAARTVRCAKSLGLGRGTEWVCKSCLGREYKELSEEVKEDSIAGRVLAIFGKLTPRHKVSSCLMVLAGSLVIIPVAAQSADGAEGLLLRGSANVEVVEDGEGSGGSGGGEGEVAAGSYEEECGPGLLPGESAPSPRREELNTLWMGGGGIDGAGGIEAGCVEPAESVAGHPGVWIQPAHCGGLLRSVGVAAPDYLPALLYQQAGEFALDHARQGTLRGASSRRSLRGGDLYVIDTDSGSFVLARDDASAGDADPPGGGSLPCERFNDGNVPYVVVPPGLIGIWLEIGEDGWAWPKPVPASEPGSVDFVFAVDGMPESEAVSARCFDDLHCAAWIDGALRTTTGSLFTSATTIVSMAD